jgi:hypothetical protein
MTRQRVTDQPLDPLSSGDGILGALILCRYEIVRPVLGRLFGRQKAEEPTWSGRGKGL